MNFFHCSFLSLMLIAACSTVEPTSTPQKSTIVELTDQEREAQLDADLQSMVEILCQNIGSRKIGIPGFYAEGTKSEPRMSLYVGPQLESLLIQRGIQVLERRDLSRIVQEQLGAMDDLFDSEKTKGSGHLLGVDALVLGTVKNLSPHVYRLDIKLTDLETGKIIATTHSMIPKNHLPITYGGR